MQSYSKFFLSENLELFPFTPVPISDILLDCLFGWTGWFWFIIFFCCNWILGYLRLLLGMFEMGRILCYYLSLFIHSSCNIFLLSFRFFSPTALLVVSLIQSPNKNDYRKLYYWKNHLHIAICPLLYYICCLSFVTILYYFFESNQQGSLLIYVLVWWCVYLPARLFIFKLFVTVVLSRNLSHQKNNNNKIEEKKKTLSI